MNKIEKGKKHLLIIGISCILLALAALAGGTVAIVLGAKSVSKGTSVQNIFEIVGGAILCVVSFLLLYSGIYFTWLGASMKAFNGSIAEPDLCQGTVNMKKCENCGAEIEDGDLICGNCGTKLTSKKICKHCGAENSSRRKYCNKCGEEL